MITLSSDFGSPYPAAMKGVILEMTDTRLVDVAHDLPRQDTRAGAFWLRQVLPYFPPAVHLAVVDPGVGSERDALVVRAGEHALVGPDNGVLVPVAAELAGDDGFEVFRIREGDGSPEDPLVWPPDSGGARLRRAICIIPLQVGDPFEREVDRRQLVLVQFRVGPQVLLGGVESSVAQQTREQALAGLLHGDVLNLLLVGPRAELRWPLIGRRLLFRPHRDPPPACGWGFEAA